MKWQHSGDENISDATFDRWKITSSVVAVKGLSYNLMRGLIKYSWMSITRADTFIDFTMTATAIKDTFLGIYFQLVKKYSAINKSKTYLHLKLRSYFLSCYKLLISNINNVVFTYFNSR